MSVERRREPPPTTRNPIERYLKSIEKLPGGLSRDQEKTLAKKIHQGDKQAYDQLVRANLRFVVKVAKEYMGFGVPLQDLIQVGAIGLMEAAKRFNASKGKFISYAVWWIRHYILREISEHSRQVRVPVHILQLYLQIAKTEWRLYQKLNRRPTPEELAKELKIPLPHVFRALELMDRKEISFDAPLNLNDDGGGGRPLSLHGVVPDNQMPPPDQKLMDESLRVDLKKALLKLTKRQRKVIKLRFGLDGGEPLTFEEIGKILGIRRQAVQQITERALKKLRPSLASKLR